MTRKIFTREATLIEFLIMLLRLAREWVLQTKILRCLISGIFHDVGKIGTADDILLKNQSLNIQEYEEIKKHPLKGAHILSAVSMFKGVVDVVKYHHERIDGLGYPEGISGEHIPLLSRIVSVADAFDSMVSDRQYRSRLDLDDAKTQLIQGKDTQFDAQIVDSFLVILKDYDRLAQEVSSTYLPNIMPHANEKAH